MNESVSAPLAQTMRTTVITSVGDLVQRRQAVADAGKGLVQIAAALDKAVADADTTHAALRQPDALKPIFDKSYDKLISQPAALMRQVIPIAVAAVDDAIKLADFLARNERDISVSGSTIQVKKPALQGEVDALLKALNAHAPQMAEAQQRVQAAFSGSQ